MRLIILYRDGVEVGRAQTHANPERLKCLVDWVSIAGQTFHANHYIELTPNSRIEL